MIDDLRSLLHWLTRISHPEGFTAGIEEARVHQDTLVSLAKLDSTALRPFLDHEASVVRQVAILELGERGDRIAIPWLSAALASATTEEAERIRGALAALGSQAMTPELVEQLKSDSPKARTEAVEGLVGLGDPAVVTHLAELLIREESKDVAAAAFFGALRLGGEAALLEALPRFSESARAGCRTLLPRDHEGLLEPLERFVRGGRALDDPSLAPVVTWLDWQWQLATLAEQEPELLSNQPEKEVHRTAALPWVLDLAEAVAWPLPDGGELVAEGRVACELRLDFEHRATSPEGDDVLRFELRLVDAEGQPWRVDLLETAGRFLPTDDPGSGSHYYLESPEPWRAAFRDRLLLSGAQTLEESRDYVTYVLGDDRFEVLYKYQGALYDFAALPGDGVDPGGLLVRVHGLREAEDWEEIPPFVTPVDLAAILPARQQHELWDQDTGELLIDSPRVQRLEGADAEGKGQAQSGVRVRSGVD